MFGETDRAHHFSMVVAGDLASDHLNYPDEYSWDGLTYSSRFVGCVLLVFPAVFLASLISRPVCAAPTPRPALHWLRL